MFSVRLESHNCTGPSSVAGHSVSSQHIGRSVLAAALRVSRPAALTLSRQLPGAMSSRASQYMGPTLAVDPP